MTLYNYTNSYGVMTYMEYPIILLQVYVLVYYVLKFKGLLSAPIVLITSLAYLTTSLGFALGILPKEILSYLVVSF